MTKFLSKQNLEHIYDYLQRDLEGINIKLDSDKKYRKAVKTMMRSIDSQIEQSGQSMSLDNLNVYAVSKIKPFLVDMFKKISDGKGKNVKQYEPEGMSMNILGYDINTTDAEVNTGDELDALFKTSITDNNNNEDSTISNEEFQKKLNEAQNSRGYSDYVKNTTSFRENVETANKMSQQDLGGLQNIKNKKRDENEFYKNLYENNESVSNKPIDFQDQSDYKEALKNGLRKDPNAKKLENSSSNDFLVNNQNDILANLVVRNKDHSKDNVIQPLTSNTGLENPIEIGQNATIQPILYENTQTGRERVNNFVINIDSGTSGTFTNFNVTNLGTNFWSNFRVNIDSPLKIDRLCEVFLESMTIIGQTVPDICPYFSINVEEFNIESSSNNPNLRDRILISNGASMEYTETGIRVTGATAVNTPGAIALGGNDATQYITVGDYLYTLGGQFIGIVTSVTGATEIIMSGGTKIALPANARLLVGRLKHNCNEHKLADGYIGTINPRRLLSFNISIKNQDGNDVDSETPDHNVFRDADSAQNRVMFTFLLKGVGEYSDF
jgi:hypothetical protein